MQDLMSIQALLGLIAQSSTLLVRGQSSLFQFPSPLRIPEALYYLVILALLILHGMVLLLRDYFRNNNSFNSSSSYEGGSSIDDDYGSYTQSHTYADLHWSVWVLMLLLPILGVFLGMHVNKLDDRHYRRYLQFLRLEFDTRLGMHSPR